ncbi:MAG: hypothetical protein BGO21_19510 [Dyadobacter sp. 50-39]|nr:MAG: hypothetical protein BGO21_19510 [Dyadobacter sp. 50-39]
MIAMERYHAILTFFVPALCVSLATEAQTRKPELPVDTVTSEIVFQDLLYRHPPQTKNPSEEKVFGCPIEPQPEYPGGYNAMYKFIETHRQMPRAAKRARISGRVFLAFNIEATGEITHVAVLKGLGFGCDEEAVRLVESMPRWKPGKRDGKPARVRFNLPISFAIK